MNGLSRLVILPGFLLVTGGNARLWVIARLLSVRVAPDEGRGYFRDGTGARAKGDLSTNDWMIANAHCAGIDCRWCSPVDARCRGTRSCGVIPCTADGLSPLVVGLTVVACGTSGRELLVSVQAAVGGGRTSPLLLSWVPILAIAGSFCVWRPCCPRFVSGHNSFGSTCRSWWG